MLPRIGSLVAQRRRQLPLSGRSIRMIPDPA
ncbi:hypothetical protein ACLK1S_23860 [Escherichia coli]